MGEGLQLAWLGSPQVRVDGGPLDVDTRKAIAILALVSIDGEKSRDRLAAMLWPDSDTARAKAALRRTLSVLHRGLGHRWLLAERQGVRLEEGPVDCDVARGERLLGEVAGHEHTDEGCDACRARLDMVVSLHRGRLLAGFSLRDSPGFEDWCAERAEHQRRRLCHALELAGRLHLAAGDLDAATDVCRRWLEVDPLNEKVHRRVMLLQAWQGHRIEVIEGYRACVAVLDRELGVAPMARTTDLYRAVLEDRVPPRPGRHPDDDVPGPTAPARPRGVPTVAAADDGHIPLVGRANELLQLVDGHEQPAGRLLVVIGEAGVGKTRLADELVARVRGAGGRAILARCHPGEVELAFGPVVELLELAVGQAPLSCLGDISPWRLAEVARLVPELVGTGRDLPTVPALSSPGAQARLFEATWEVLEHTLTVDQRGLVVLDDLHAVDAASLDLLGHGLRRIADRDLTVLVCLRPEEVVDDHPVRRHLLDHPDIRDAASEVVLDRLSAVEVDELVRGALDRPDAAAIAEQILAESEGLPLLVVEYVRLVQEAGPVADGGAVDLGQLVPRGAAELARRRLVDVSETGRQVASTAATIGRSFDLSVLLHASGRTEEEVVEGLDELTRRQIVRELPHDDHVEVVEPRYDFVHDKLRQSIYERTTLARRRLLHRRVAEALTAGTRGRHDAGATLIAEHHRRGGRDVEAAAWFRRAGDHARSLFATHDALGNYERALALDPADACELHARVGELRILLGDYPRARAALELAAAQAPDDDQLAEVEHQLGALHLRLGDLDAAVAHLDRGVELSVGDTRRCARLHADRALVAVRADQPERAEAEAAAARDLADGSDDVEARAQVHNVLGLLARHTGDHPTARRHFAASLELAAGLVDPAVRIAAMNNLALADADTGALDAALAGTVEALDLVARRGDRHREAALRNNLADLLHRAGREEESMAALKEAVAIFAEVGEDPAGLHPEIWKLVDW